MGVSLSHQLSIVPRQQEECFFWSQCHVWPRLESRECVTLWGQVELCGWGRSVRRLSSVAQDTRSPLADRGLERSFGPDDEELQWPFC